MRSPRIRNFTEWAGLAAVVAVTAMYAVNIWWGVLWAPTPTLQLGFVQGTAGWEWVDAPLAGVSSVPRIVRPDPSGLCWWYQTLVGMPVHMVVLPLWVPLLVVAMPTCLLWHADLRARRRLAMVGRCGACGYDRGGLAADVACPECGKPPRSPP